MEDTPLLVVVDTPILVVEDTPILVVVDTPILVVVDTPILVVVDTPILVVVDTPILVVVDTPILVVVDTPILVVVDTHTYYLYSASTSWGPHPKRLFCTALSMYLYVDVRTCKSNATQFAPVVTCCLHAILYQVVEYPDSEVFVIDAENGEWLRLHAESVNVRPFTV